MNRARRLIVALYLVAVCVACIYVPWRTKTGNQFTQNYVSRGYAPIWTTTQYRQNETEQNAAAEKRERQTLTMSAEELRGAKENNSSTQSKEAFTKPWVGEVDLTRVGLELGSLSSLFGALFLAFGRGLGRERVGERGDN